MAIKKVYLVAYYFMRPKNQRVRTNVAGWLQDENNVTWDEQIALTTKIKEKDLTMAKVILNLSDRVVFRNSINDNKNFDDLFDHYYKNYQKDLHQVADSLGYFKSNAPVVEQPDATVFTVPAESISTVVTENQTVQSS